MSSDEVNPIEIDMGGIARKLDNLGIDWNMVVIVILMLAVIALYSIYNRDIAACNAFWQEKMKACEPFNFIIKK